MVRGLGCMDVTSGLYTGYLRVTVKVSLVGYSSLLNNDLKN